MEQIREDTHIQAIDFYKGGNTIETKKGLFQRISPCNPVGKMKPGARAIYLYEANELTSLTYTIYKN